MKGIRIIATGRALPKKQISNDDMSKIVDTSDEWITARTGIKNRYRCEEESCLTLAAEAAKNAIDLAGIPVSDIGVVVVATQTPDNIFPSVASMLQKELGLEENIAAFDISAACTGFLMGLGVARGMLEASSKRYGLVIGSEELSRIVDYTDRSTCVLFGDGAGAALIENADNDFVQKCWARADYEALNCKGPGNNDAMLHMNGNRVFKFAVNALEQGIEEIFKEKNISMADLDFCICHQANERIIRHVMKKYPGYEDKFYINVNKYGNTSAASIPIALDELNRDGRLREGMKILCVAFGAGLVWSSIYMQL
ncbi:MAG: ketoacyl-ACP synthase III [Lachnospiraceae bacterium]|nr:ketoacyl-ACP synthase III [Lachnospiraceae bacterium]